VHLVGFTIEIYYDALPYEGHILSVFAVRKWEVCCSKRISIL